MVLLAEAVSLPRLPHRARRVAEGSGLGTCCTAAAAAAAAVAPASSCAGPGARLGTPSESLAVTQPAASEPGKRVRLILISTSTNTNRRCESMARRHSP